jgi:hypothetical protein
MLISDRYLKIDSWINIKKHILIIDTPILGHFDEYSENLSGQVNDLAETLVPPG